MSKQVLEQEEYEDQASGPNWTLIIVGYFAVLAVVITLLRPLHMSMGGIFFSMVIAGVVLALALFLLKRSIQTFQARGITVGQAVKTKYRRAIGYDGLPDEEEDEQEQAPASYIADRDPLNLGEHFKPSFHAFLCVMCLIVGIRRSGKSTLLLALVEELARYGLPFVLFDTQGEYSGLVSPKFLRNPRLAGNVEQMSDTPDAALPYLANLTTENAYTCGKTAVKNVLQLVVNLKGYNDDEAAIIMSEIVDGVNDWQEARPNDKRIPFMFFLDEAQKWFPQDKADRAQDIKPETQAELQESFIGKVVERGGKNGLGLVAATQRYSRINKSLLQGQWKFYLRQTEEIDLARYKRQGIDPDDARNLQQGEVIAFGPDVDHFTFQCRRSYTPHEGHTPNAQALIKYTKELDFESLQKTGAFIDDMQLEPANRNATRNVSPELPDQGQKSRLSLVRNAPGTPKDVPNRLPEDDLDAPGGEPECTSETNSDDFQPVNDDLLLSELQAELLILFYGNPKSSSYGNVAESLKQIKNEKGQGLGGRYNRHASYILEQRGLKKGKKA
jgi:hypothetical protein